MITYTIKRDGECVFIFDGVPAQDMMILMKLAPEDSVMDCDAARLMGCNIAIGPADQMNAIKASLAPHAERVTRAENPGLSAAACRWLAGGERGISSNTIFEHLTGVEALKGWDPHPPRDLSDFRRCQLLLEAVPELVPQFHRMAELPGWRRLVAEWENIVAAMTQECPDWRKGEGAYPTKARVLLDSALKL